MEDNKSNLSKICRICFKLLDKKGFFINTKQIMKIFTQHIHAKNVIYMLQWL